MNSIEYSAVYYGFFLSRVGGGSGPLRTGTCAGAPFASAKLRRCFTPQNKKCFFYIQTYEKLDPPKNKHVIKILIRFLTTTSSPLVHELQNALADVAYIL